MSNKLDTLLPDGFYHIFNRAVGEEKLFLTNENYLFFLRRYKYYLNGFVDTYSYCLMSNHFHFLIKVKSHDEIIQFINKQNENSSDAFLELSELEKDEFIIKRISKQFSNLFNSYTKAFNKQQNRLGSLFNRPFKRKQITSEEYLRELVRYVHRNPITAKLTDNYNWKYSSYPIILSNESTFIKRKDLIHYFDDLDNFIFFHEE